MAKRWTLLLARDLPVKATHHRERLQQEILAYIRCLVELKSGIGRSGLRRVKQRLAELPNPLSPNLAIAPPTDEGRRRQSVEASRVLPQSQTAGDSFEFLPSTSHSAKAANDFTLTRAAMKRFCRLTGMEPTTFAGTGEAQAGLVFYVVAFALLSDLDHASDLEMTLTLKRLRVCREELSQAVTKILTGEIARKQYSIHELRSSLTRTLGLPPSKV